MAKIIKFGDIDIKKQKFHQHEGPIDIYIYNLYKCAKKGC